MNRIVLILALICLRLEAKMIETRYVEEILPLIDEETWFLVDLDNCLFQGAEALGHANWFYDEIEQRMQKGMNRDEAIREFYPNWVEVQRVSCVIPIEQALVPALQRLQNRGVVIMGLTHRQPAIAESTFRQVASLGFNFGKTAPEGHFVVPSQNPTLYQNGILFVGDYNKKSEIFKEFIEIINKRPKKIVFIDDKRKNVEELESLGIEYVGVHYRAIEYAKPIYHRECHEN